MICASLISGSTGEIASPSHELSTTQHKQSSLENSCRCDRRVVFSLVKSLGAQPVAEGASAAEPVPLTWTAQENFVRRIKEGMRANWRMDWEDRKKRVKMNHAARMKIGLLEGTNSRSEPRNLFGLEADAHEKKCACGQPRLVRCSVYSSHLLNGNHDCL